MAVPAHAGNDAAAPGAGRDLQPLFRAEVMQRQQSQWMGTVLLAPRMSATVISIAAVAAAITILLMLLLGSYARKASIEGWLMPEQGLARVHAPRSGTVCSIYVREGVMVKKGEPLLSISGEVQSEAFGATVETIIQRLAVRRDSMAEAKHAQHKLYDGKQADMRQRIAALDDQLKHLEVQIALQRDRLAIGKDVLGRERDMQARDLITVTRLRRSEQEYLEQASRFEALERDNAALQSQKSQLDAALAELPVLRANAIAELDRSMAALEQELAEVEARRSTIIVAPEDGTVTAILTEPGGNATPEAPLLSLVPAGSPLQAQLYGASRAVGFVEAGQRVSLRLQPFPYQRFGTYGGVVVNVSRSPVNPAELPVKLRSQAGPGEPLYRITVRLDQQTATAYGKPVALQAGMQLEADVVIETRSLMGWILDPLYTLKGRAAS